MASWAFGILRRKDDGGVFSTAAVSLALLKVRRMALLNVIEYEAHRMNSAAPVDAPVPLVVAPTSSSMACSEYMLC